MNRIDTFIAAALEEFVTDTAHLLDAARQQKPLDRDEIDFWKRQSNAFVKAQTYFLQGVRLTATPSGYTVPSASRPGALVHRLYRVGGVWHCSCEAGQRGIFHWHAAMVAVYERGYELAGYEDDTDADAGGEEPPTPIALIATPSGLVLSHHGVTEIAASPATLAAAIGRLTTPAQLGTRIAQARARLAA